MKKLLIIAVMIPFLLPAMCLAQDSTATGDWFLTGQGGAWSSWSQVKEGGHIYGTAVFEVTRMVFGDNLAVRADFQKINGDIGEWMDFQGATVLYTRNPRLHKFQPYLFAGGGVAASKESEDDVNGSWSGGMGLLVPIHMFGADFDAIAEFRGKGIAGETFGMISVGLQVPMPTKR